MRSTGDLTDVSGLQPGDHVCLAFGSDDEHRAVLTPYMRDGLLAGDRVVYFGEAYGADVVGSYLADAGLPVHEYMASGRLAIVPAVAAYIPGGRFDAEGMLRTFQEHTQRALDDGYRSLRAAGEMSWVVPEVVDERTLVDYEYRADVATASARQVGLCIYDRRRTDARTLARVAAVHAARIGQPDERLLVSVYASGDGRVCVDGEVDVSNSEFFEQILGSIVSAVPDPVLDLAELEFIDARGLATLAKMAGDLETEGRRLTLASIPEFVHRCLALVGGERLLPAPTARG